MLLKKVSRTDTTASYQNEKNDQFNLCIVSGLNKRCSGYSERVKKLAECQRKKILLESKDGWERDRLRNCYNRVAAPRFWRPAPRVWD